MKVAKLAYTRSDLLFGTSELALIKQSIFEQDAKVFLKILNGVIRYAHTNVEHLRFLSLEWDDARIVGYSDAAYANSRHLSLQLRRVIVQVYKSDNPTAVSFKSYKSRRVTRSVLSAETMEFADMFNDALVLQSQVEQALGRIHLMHLLTDSITFWYDKQKVTH